MSDRHIRRNGEDYGTAFLALLPQGQAWPKWPGSTLDLACRGLAYYWGEVDRRAADLLEQESDPRITLELLPDWERAWGLPDPCYQAPQTIGERQQALIMRMTMLGAQSREFFIDVAAQIGYTITISEFRVFVCGIDRCGDNRVYGDGTGSMYNEWGNPILNPRGVPVAYNELSAWPNYGLGPPSNRFYWTVYVDAKKLIWFRVGGGFGFVTTKLTWFRVGIDGGKCGTDPLLLIEPTSQIGPGGGGGQCGIDPHLRIGLADDLECLLNRWKPAHTIIIFDYSKPPPVGDKLIWFRVSVHQCGVDPHLTIIPAPPP